MASLTASGSWIGASPREARWDRSRYAKGSASAANFSANDRSIGKTLARICSSGSAGALSENVDSNGSRRIRFHVALSECGMAGGSLQTSTGLNICARVVCEFVYVGRRASGPLLFSHTCYLPSRVSVCVCVSSCFEAPSFLSHMLRTGLTSWPDWFRLRQKNVSLPVSSCGQRGDERERVCVCACLVPFRSRRLFLSIKGVSVDMRVCVCVRAREDNSSSSHLEDADIDRVSRVRLLEKRQADTVPEPGQLRGSS